MSSPVKILVVEDELIIGAKISMHLEEMGYEVSGIVSRGEEAIKHVKHSPPDILIMDINLKGSMSGIDTVQSINEEVTIPVIYLTANADQHTFDRAKETQPYAFIIKPYKKTDLQRAIELIISRQASQEGSTDHPKADSLDQPYSLDDRIFIRYRESMIKLLLSEICYIEASRSYCNIVTQESSHLLSVPLKRLEDKLRSGNFFRIHRSYIVNLERMEKVAENHVVVLDKCIPIGKSYKESFLRRIQLI